ncbi:hypothetical protein DFJ73DRAFT_823145 [Zopfochytrium polystomum]|nr:hypothetical protein DFJ73DRAFT_823145 [Zopfochytrium polystomum]
MREFLEQTLRKYYELIGWNEEAVSYSNLCHWSKAILEFDSPNGLLLSVGKSVSPILKSSYSLGIPDNRTAAGFLVVSSPLALPKPFPLHDEDQTYNPTTEKDVSSDADLVLLGEDPNDLFWKRLGLLYKPRFMTNYLLYGRLFHNLRLEGLYCQSITKKDMIVMSGMNSWYKDDAQIAAQYTHKAKNWCIETSYSSDAHVLGVNSLLRIPDTNWYVGGEVCYTAKERSGGLSVGAKYDKWYTDRVHSIVTLLANPMMGHVSASFTSTVFPDLVMSTAYDFNTYSYESDLSLGLEYAPKDAEQVLKAKFGLSKGIGLKIEGRYNGQVLVGIGMTTEFSLKPRSTFGVEINFV